MKKFIIYFVSNASLEFLGEEIDSNSEHIIYKKVTMGGIESYITVMRSNTLYVEEKAIQ